MADSGSVGRLYVEAGWLTAAEARPEAITRMIEGSICFLAAFVGNDAVGMGRAIGDGVSDAYIQDVFVSPACRHLGVASRIIESIVEHLERSGVSWIGLVAEPGTAGLYETLGFVPLAGHQAMILKRKKG